MDKSSIPQARVHTSLGEERDVLWEDLGLVGLTLVSNISFPSASGHIERSRCPILFQQNNTIHYCKFML